MNDINVLDFNDVINLLFPLEGAKVHNLHQILCEFVYLIII